MHIALAVNYVDQTEFDTISNNLEKLGAQIGAFISYLEKARNEKQFIKK